MINLDDNIPGCKNFIWREALHLDSLGACVYADDEVIENLTEIFQKLQWIRNYFNRSIKINSAYRPVKYNRHIGGSYRSQHIAGKAIDFRVKGVRCDKVREAMIPELEMLGLRMEKLPKSNWVHIDTGEVIKNRYFRP